LGYFDKMAKVDLFVVLDDLIYDPASFQHRNRIKTAGGAEWLDVPIESGREGERILEQRIDNNTDWQARSWQALERAYRDAPFFSMYAAELRDAYTRRWNRLVELDLHILDLARQWLRVHVPIVRASTLDLQGDKTDRIIDLCKKVGARAYISGSGESCGYLDAEKMGRSGVGVIWQHFDHPTYSQLHGPFESHLGFIDLLFNCGAESSELMFARSHPLRATI